MGARGVKSRITISPMEARQRLLEGWTVKRLAETQGVQPCTMSHWLRWKGVTERSNGLIKQSAANRPNMSFQPDDAQQVSWNPAIAEADDVAPNLPSADAGEARMMAVQQLLQLARDLGMDRQQLATLQTRIVGRTVRETARDDREAIERMREARDRALDYLDDVSLAAAPAKDLSSVVAVLTDRIQLLSGQPTAIMRVEDRRQIDTLAEALMAELVRRGKGPVIDGEAVAVT